MTCHRRLGRRHAWGLLVSAVALVLAVSGCSGWGGAASNVAATALPKPGPVPSGTVDPATNPDLARFYDQKVQWEPCEGDFQCGHLTVPIDWSEPGGATIKLALMKLPAEEEAISSLVVNPGGPGVSGLSYVRAARLVFGRPVLRSFDVVGFDPRGVGESAPLRCLSNDEIDVAVAQDQSPDDADELAKAVVEIKDFADACERNSGRLLAHVDTISVVRDMDVLRAAVGDEVLTYQGASYGTFLGAWYAQLFPWRVGRFVLDGATDPQLNAEQYTDGQARGFSRALRAYVQDCQAGPGCPLRGTLQEGLNQLANLVQQADTEPLRTDLGRPLTQSLMTTGIIQALYDESFWSALTMALGRAQRGDGTGLLRLAYTYLDRSEDGVYGQSYAATPAMYCIDLPEERSPEQIAEAARALGRKYPPLGEVIGWSSLSCAEWPIPAVTPRKKLTAQGAAPILVLGTVNDPATPYEWAQSLAAQLSSGRLLTWEGDVHTAYGRGSACVDDAVEGYLLSGELPAEGTVCT